MTDLVKRVRRIGIGSELGAIIRDRTTAQEAADRIEALEKAYAQQQLVWSDAIARADRYEAALRQFADENNWEEWVGWVGDGEPQDIARAALEGKKDD